MFVYHRSKLVSRAIIRTYPTLGVLSLYSTSYIHFLVAFFSSIMRSRSGKPLVLLPMIVYAIRHVIVIVAISLGSEER
jgi:hypothetical protein